MRLVVTTNWFSGAAHAPCRNELTVVWLPRRLGEVGKAFGLSDDTVGALAGMLWGWSDQAVSEKDASRAGLDPADPHLAKVLALAEELIGFPRHLSQHVGGFVITRGRLDEVVPIENAAMADRTCVEWDKDDLDALAILKVDVLALGMLTCLRRGFELLNKHYPGWMTQDGEHGTENGEPASQIAPPFSRDPVRFTRSL